MKEINLEELKNIELNMLIDFAKFCDDNNFTYYLSGGTLLGAIRHRGFIPWDDDIDIMMPREDYNKAIKTYKNDIYKIDSIRENPNSYNRYARINNIKTKLESNLRQHLKESVFIDIFPIDGLAGSKFKQDVIFGIQQILIAFHLSTILKYTISSRYEDREAGFFAWRKYLRTFIKFVMVATIGRTNPGIWASILNKIASRYSFYNRDYVAILVSGPHFTKERMPKNIYKNKVKVEFEGYKFWAPDGYDYYLKSLYGNYMELPPIDKRISHHDFKAYWKEEKDI